MVAAGHNISPRLHKQLVLKLEIGVVAAKLLELFPRGVLVGQPAPLDADVPDPTPLLGAYNSLWLRKDAAMEQWRHNPRRRRRVPAVRLEQPHVKDIMNPCAVRKLETVGDLAHAFQHLERPNVVGTKLMPGLQILRLRGPVEEAQPDPVANVELQVVVVGVVVLLGELLRL
jgi:hypothetical protein